MKAKRSMAALLIAPVIGVASFLIPAAATAQPTVKLRPVCVKQKGPANLNLQIGYCPNG